MSIVYTPKRFHYYYDDAWGAEFFFFFFVIFHIKFCVGIDNDTTNVKKKISYLTVKNID